MSSFDVCIIGGGVIGCAIARELSRFDLRIAVLERCSDVSEGTTKANSAIVHAGYDAKPGSNKAVYNVRGNRMFDSWCRELDVSFDRNSSLVLAFSEEGLPELEKLKARGRQNGVSGLSIVGRDRLRQLEPAVGSEACYALQAKTGGICSPYELNIRLAEHASVNGVQIFRDCHAKTIIQQGREFQIVTSNKRFSCQVLINAAGVFADEINNQISPDSFHIVPRRGEYWMIDKACGPVFRATIFQLPTAMGKGVLITPTVEGTIIIGPSAENIEDKLDVRTTADKLSHILEIASKSWPNMPDRQFITQFAGLRAHCDRDDFILGPDPAVPGYFRAAGIESPGLTAVPAIAEDIAAQAADFLSAVKKTWMQPAPPLSPMFRLIDNELRASLIQENPQFGRIICRCEQVSEAEIRDAIRRPVGAVSVDGVKRRTRAGMGRCQGGFCQPSVIRILSDELGISPLEITKMGGQSNILTGRLGGDDHE